jgi:bud site selection protein 31
MRRAESGNEEEYRKVIGEIEEMQKEMERAIHEIDSHPKREVRVRKILRISRRRTRAVYKMYKRGEIGRKTLGRCVKERVVDLEMIKAWRRNGYERVCCLLCVGGSICICRVPRGKVSEEVECFSCGCHGCS